MPKVRSKEWSLDKEADGGNLEKKEMLSAKMLCANIEMLSAHVKQSGGLQRWIRQRRRRRRHFGALLSKGCGTSLLCHSLSLPVRILLNRRAPWSLCVNGFESATPASARARGFPRALKFSLPDALVSHRYISKLEEVTRITGRRLVP